MLDDVVRYVLDEVAMDGSIGTSPSRFIALFTRTACPINLATDDSPPTHDTIEQDEDGHPIIVVPPAVEDLDPEQQREREQYAAYVWRMVVDLQGLRVELLSDAGKIEEVRDNVAGVQPSQQDLGKVDDEEELKTVDAMETDQVDFALDPSLSTETPAQPAAAPAAATEVHEEPAAPSSLETDKYDLLLLREKYGDKVVIRASEAEVMNTLSGSYVRPARMSNIVYTALQYIARGKEFGMPVFDIAKKTGQKPSTVFYLVKTLTDMGLVAKIKDTESNKTNIAVHRRYLSENFQYQLRVGYLEYIARQAAETAKPSRASEAASASVVMDVEENIPIDQTSGLPKFPPFGLESLGSRSFIRYRLVKLLKSDLWHHLIENKLLLKFLGFIPAYTLQTRRQFQRHISAFKREGLIDEVLVPDEFKPDKPHRCLRLAEFRPKSDEKETFEGTLPDVVSTVIDPALLDTEDIEDEELLDEEDAEQPFAPKELGYEHCYTIDHAVLQVVRHSGTQGITMRQIMRQLNNLDHKTVDVIVARYERLEHHPTHLNDFLFKVTQEVYRREKRLRVFTLENFRQRCIEDGIQLDNEIPKHPNIGRYADLSDYKFCKTRADAKVVLDAEAINVPRVSDKITREHRIYCQIPTHAGRPIPRAGKSKIAGDEMGELQALGRPRKFIRIIGLDGKLAKRTQQSLIPVHPELPSVYLYNSETKVFFDVPDDWPGIGPIEEPPNWHTATEPWCPIIPSTGKLARKEVKADAKLKNRKAIPARKAATTKGKPTMAAAGDPPPQSKKIGRPRKNAKSLQREIEEISEDQQSSTDRVREVHPNTAAAEAKRATHKQEKSQPIIGDEPTAMQPASKRKGRPRKNAAVYSNTTSEKQVIDLDEPVIVDVMDPDTPASQSGTEVVIVTKKRGRAGRTTVTAGDDLDPVIHIDPALLPATEVDIYESEPIGSSKRHKGAGIVTDTAEVSTTEGQQQQVVDRNQVAASVTKSSDLPSTNVDDAYVTQSQDNALLSGEPNASPLKELSIHDTSALRDSIYTPGTAKKRPRKSRLDGPTQAEETSFDTGEPDPKRSKTKYTKLVKPRILIQHLYRKREILEFIREVGGVTTGGGFLCVNLWDWAQEHKKGNSAFDGAPDKATIERLISSLENDGELKQIFVALDVQWGGSDRISVVRLPDTPQDKVNAFINDVKHIRQRATILPPLAPEPGFTRTLSKAEVPHIRPVRLTEEALETLITPVSALEALPADQVRQMFLKDWRLLAQHYGYVVGMFRRAKYLHLEMVKMLPSHVQLLHNGDRVLEVDFLRSELSLRTICRILPVTVQDRKLEQLLQDPQQADVPFRESPRFAQFMIAVKRRTMRFKLARLLLLLAKLHVLETGFLVTEEDGSAVKFDSRAEESATHVRFPQHIPIYNYGSTEDIATLPLKMINIESAESAEEYWYAVWFLSLTKGDVNTAAITNFSDPSTVTATQPAVVPPTLKRKLSIRRHWQSEYVLQKSQRRYLDYVYQAEGPAVVTDTERHAALSYRLFAPMENVAEYFQHLSTRLSDTANVRLHYSSTRVPVQPVRAVIAEKVRIRKERLEGEWAGEVARALSQIGQQSSEALLAFLEPLHKQYLRTPSKYGPQQMMNAVTSYFARLDNTGSVRRKRGRFTTVAPLSNLHSATRLRTRWTSAMEELARDAFVILEARKERLGVQYAGHNEVLGQLFSAIDATKVRTRVLKWRRQHPANEAYLQRMQAAWKQVCEDHANEIHDPHPDSYEDFDLMGYIAILRKYVKKELHVSSFFAKVDEADRMPVLPASVAELTKLFEARPRHKQIQVLDDVWVIYGDEKRDKALLSASTVTPRLADETSLDDESTSKERGLIDSAIKMIVANPLESFDEEQADNLLLPFHRPTVEAHVKDMLQKGVLTSYEKSNVVKAPGRAYHLQESYHRALDTPISQVLQHDAEELLHTVPEDDLVPWPIISKEGEFASLLGLISEDMVDMQIETDFALDILDTKGFRRARVIDDDCIELGINLKLNEKGIQAVEAPEKPHAPVWVSNISTGTKAEASSAEKQFVKKRQRVLSASALIDAVENAGKNGIALYDLKNYFNSSDTVIITAVEKALANNKLILSGYSRAILVHPRYRSEWQLSDAVPYPKQWLDVYGQKIEPAFVKCIRAVYGLIVQKPGITQSDLRQALDGVFDRQELNDLLCHMQQRERIRRVAPKDIAISAEYVDLLDSRYEGLVSYFPDSLW